MSIGKEELLDEGPLNKLLISINQTTPNSQIFILISPYTLVDYDNFSKYSMDIIFERVSNNLTVSEVEKMYHGQFAYKLWFWVHRFEFYVEFFSKHPELENIMLMDEDSLILRDPLEIFKQDPDPFLLHMMYDYLDFSAHQDWNYLWVNGLNNYLDSGNRRQKCGIPHLKHNLHSSYMRKQLPFNCGLIYGKASEILKLSKLVAAASLCVDVFFYVCDQGIFNYLYYSGEIDRIGIKIKGYHMRDCQFISCCEHLTVECTKHSSEWYVIHHYIYMKYPSLLTPRIANLTASDSTN